MYQKMSYHTPPFILNQKLGWGFTNKVHFKHWNVGPIRLSMHLRFILVSLISYSISCIFILHNTRKYLKVNNETRKKSIRFKKDYKIFARLFFSLYIYI